MPSASFVATAGLPVWRLYMCEKCFCSSVAVKLAWRCGDDQDQVSTCCCPPTRFFCASPQAERNCCPTNYRCYCSRNFLARLLLYDGCTLAQPRAAALAKLKRRLRLGCKVSRTSTPTPEASGDFGCVANTKKTFLPLIISPVQRGVWPGIARKGRACPLRPCRLNVCLFPRTPPRTPFSSVQASSHKSRLLGQRGSFLGCPSRTAFTSRPQVLGGWGFRCVFPEKSEMQGSSERRSGPAARKSLTLELRGPSIAAARLAWPAMLLGLSKCTPRV